MQKVFRTNTLKLVSLSGRINYTMQPRTTAISHKTIEVQRPQRFSKSNPAPFAYNQFYEYPQDYRPWTQNYIGTALFSAGLLLCYFSIYQFEQYYLQRCEYDKRPERKYYKM